MTTKMKKVFRSSIERTRVAHSRRRVLTYADLALDPLDTAQKLFAKGYSLCAAGELREARRHFHHVIAQLEVWRDVAICEGRDATLATIALRHGAKLIKLRVFDDAYSALSAASHYAEQAMAESAASPVAAVLASAQGWRALAQRFIGEHSKAKASYERSAAMWRMLIVFARTRADRIAYRRALAAVLFGLGKNLRLLGNHAEADRCKEESTDLFRKLRQQ